MISMSHPKTAYLRNYNIQPATGCPISRVLGLLVKGNPDDKP
jgi:hypothetical protein